MSAPNKVKKKAISKANTQLPTLHPHAAGIDIGATEIQVAVPCDADPDPVRTFTTFTDDLLALRDWLLQCGVKTIAMESTSVYWIPLFQILEAAGLEVVGFFHSHPNHPATPSTFDRERAWGSYVYVIVHVTPNGAQETTAWELVGEAMTPVKIDDLT